MKQKLMHWLVVAAFMLGACAAGVEARPNVYWETQPALVDVDPGVQVVENHDEEVFVSGGAYWVQRGGSWWSAPDYHGRWVVAEPRVVPEKIRAYPAGRYRHYRKP